MHRARLKAVPLVLSLVVLTTYLFLPTKNYYWDGIGFAQSIEDSPGLGSTLVDPNHLVYRLVGYCIYTPVQRMGLPIRALEVLRITNSLLSAVSAYLLFRILMSFLGSVYLSGVLTLLFSFSATWWKFSTDANAYIPSVLFLLVSFYLILPTRKSKPILVALTHSVGMLFHQLAIFFYPVILLGIFQQTTLLTVRRRVLHLLQYSLVAFALTFSAFYSGFYVSQGSLDFIRFTDWITVHSPEVSFSFDLGSNLFYSLRGHLRLFLGGKLSLFLQLLNVFVVGLTLLFLGLLAVLCLKLRGSGAEVKLLFAAALKSEHRFRPLLVLGTAWVAFYVFFLFFWLPQNTFYRLFYLPAIILLVGALLAQYEAGNRQPRRYRAALFAAMVAVFNLTFYILPYSHAEANQPLVFALKMERVWSEGTVVYYATFTTDDSTVRYFNPRTTWRRLDPGQLARLERELQETYRSGDTAWFDTTAVDLFMSNQAAFGKWLSEHTKQQAKYELVDDKYRIRFFQIFPREDQEELEAPTNGIGGKLVRLETEKT